MRIAGALSLLHLGIRYIVHSFKSTALLRNWLGVKQGLSKSTSKQYWKILISDCGIVIYILRKYV